MENVNLFLTILSFIFKRSKFENSNMEKILLYKGRDENILKFYTKTQIFGIATNAQRTLSPIVNNQSHHLRTPNGR